MFSISLHSKKMTPEEFYTCFGCEPKKGRTYFNFLDRLTFSHIIEKVSTRAFH